MFRGLVPVDAEPYLQGQDDQVCRCADEREDEEEQD